MNAYLYLYGKAIGFPTRRTLNKTKRLAKFAFFHQRHGSMGLNKCWRGRGIPYVFDKPFLFEVNIIRAEEQNDDT